MNLSNRKFIFQSSPYKAYWHISKERLIVESAILESIPTQEALDEIRVRQKIIGCIDQRLEEI